ncbi:MAG TPA: hypothetical protein VHS27_01825 [Gaiellales bacterium]|jgi:hypothetical protein|nr:hypothetical protein [Gaiellales bacterium]
MRVNWLARALAVTGLSAVSAVAAHKGPTALGAGRPFLFALAGAALATLGVAALLASAVSRAARAARVRRGDLLAARLDPETAPGASALVAVLLVCQAGAHVGLILAGVAAHGGAPAPIALHVVFALAAAAVVIGVERLLGSARATLAEAIATAVARLEGRAAQIAAPPVSFPLPAHCGRAHRGRAPPLAAAS